MATIYQRNERLKEQILKPENCHCTYREITGANTAKAFCTDDNSIKASITWFHKDNKSRIILALPFGVSYNKVVKAADGVSEIDEAILSLFIKMDDAWQETT